MAAEAGKENIKHDFQFNANLDNGTVTLVCEDKAQNKKYSCTYTKNDYQNIDDEFLKMKKAIEGGNAQINPPDYNGGPVGLLFIPSLSSLCHYK